MARLLFLFLFVFVCAAVAANDAGLDERARDLAHELRCLVCQNQTIADSNAPLAQDLRGQIREQLAAGRSDAEVLDYMVARYGDFVLYRPPFKASTLALWAGPFVLLALGAFVFWRRVARRRPQAPPALSAAERAQAAKLLE